LDFELIRNIGIMIVASAAAILLLRPLKVPTIVAFILVGLLLGPVLGIVSLAPDHSHGHGGSIATVGEIGIALLLFIVGLELSLAKIKDVGKVALIAGGLQMLLTSLAVFLIALLFRLTAIESLILAIALTFSSTAVVVQMLDQRKQLQHLYGQICVGVLLVQDVVVIIALTMLAGLNTESSMDLATAMGSLAKAFGGMAILLCIAALAARYLLERPFSWAAQSPDTLLIWSLCLCFGFVFAAESLGLSPELGAFLAGLSLAQLRCSEDLKRRIHPLTNFFLALAFISLGAQLELADALGRIPLIVPLVAVVLIGKFLLFLWLIPRFGYSLQTAFLTGITLAQTSEFAFIFCAAAVSARMVDSSMLSVVGIVGLVTIGASAFLINANHALYRWAHARQWLNVFKASSANDRADPVHLRNHIVVVGMNDLGRRIATELHSQGQIVLALDSDAAKLASLPCQTLLGSIEYHSVLEEASLAHARLGISALNIEEANAFFTFQCSKLGVPCAVHAFDWTVFDELRHLGADYLIDSKAQGSARLVEELHRRGIVDL
jgi:Kef-type K+ transport system membrane component KefB